MIMELWLQHDYNSMIIMRRCSLSAVTSLAAAADQNHATE
jgi:hypothetical protein